MGRPTGSMAEEIMKLSNVVGRSELSAGEKGVMPGNGARAHSARRTRAK